MKVKDSYVNSDYLVKKFNCTKEESCTNNELYELRRELELYKYLESSKRRFLAILSHELRTPINIIYSINQLLTDSANKECDQFKRTYCKYKNNLNSNCFRLLRLANNLIEINKIEEKDVKLSLNYYNIVKVIEDTVDVVRDYIKNSKLNITFSTSDEEIYLYCDVERIIKVILNILSNAIKFSNKNIYINIIKHDRFVNITFKDDGIGIPNDMKDIIFDAFVQVDDSLTRKEEGLGIGLFISRLLIELHNGSINIESNNDIGSIFSVSLPLVDNINTKQIKCIEIDRILVAVELSDIYI